MIGLDTNVLVRYLAQDDKRQSAAATELIENSLSDGGPGFVSIVVLVELYWVLQRVYGATRDELRQTIGDLLGARQLVIEQREVVLEALHAMDASQCDFADALVAAIGGRAGCHETVTFDKGAIKIPGMRLLRT